MFVLNCCPRLGMRRTCRAPGSNVVTRRALPLAKASLWTCSPSQALTCLCSLDRWALWIPFRSLSLSLRIILLSIIALSIPILYARTRTHTHTRTHIDNFLFCPILLLSPSFLAYLLSPPCPLLFSLSLNIPWILWVSFPSPCTVCSSLRIWVCRASLLR